MNDRSTERANKTIRFLNKKDQVRVVAITIFNNDIQEKEESPVNVLE